MNTYQRQLLDKLITKLTATATPSLYAAQILAAELKGAMHAQIIGDDQSAPQIDTPTLDADGWVENSGVDPECMLWGLKIQNNKGSEYETPTSSTDFIWKKEAGITHYRPA